MLIDNAYRTSCRHRTRQKYPRHGFAASSQVTEHNARAIFPCLKRSASRTCVAANNNILCVHNVIQRLNHDATVRHAPASLRYPVRTPCFLLASAYYFACLQRDSPASLGTNRHPQGSRVVIHVYSRSLKCESIDRSQMTARIALRRTAQPRLSVRTLV